MEFLSRARCGWGVKEQSQKLCVWMVSPLPGPGHYSISTFPMNYALSRGLSFIVRAKRILECYKKQFGNFIWCEQYSSAVFFLHKLIFTFTTSLNPPFTSEFVTCLSVTSDSTPLVTSEVCALPFALVDMLLFQSSFVFFFFYQKIVNFLKMSSGKTLAETSPQ